MRLWYFFDTKLSNIIFRAYADDSVSIDSDPMISLQIAEVLMCNCDILWLNILHIFQLCIFRAHGPVLMDWISGWHCPS